MRFDVFGRQVVVERREGAWAVFYPGAEGKRRRADDLVIPASVREEDLARYLEDLCHEWATEESPSVRRIG